MRFERAGQRLRFYLLGLYQGGHGTTSNFDGFTLPVYTRNEFMGEQFKLKMNLTGDGGIVQRGTTDEITVFKTEDNVKGVTI